MKKYLWLSFLITGVYHISFSQTWSTAGNALTGTEKFGATNNQPLNIYTNNLVRLKISNTGLVSIGTTAPAATDKFTVRGIVPAPTGVFTQTKGIFSELSGSFYSDYNNLGIAVYGKCNNNNNFGYGGYFQGDLFGAYTTATGYNSVATGLYGLAESYNGTAFGVSGAAVKNTTAYNYGVQGYADAATTTSVGVIGIDGLGGPGSAGFFSGDLEYTGSLYDVSDAKFKSDIKDITSALEKINLLSPKSYILNQNQFEGFNFGKSNEYGFIAQEIAVVFPELVKNCVAPVNPFEEGAQPLARPFTYQAVNYVGLIPVITKAIQEQQTIISEQQILITKLEQRLDELESQTKSASYSSLLPNNAWINQNSPNPFSNSTTIWYSIPETAYSAVLLIADFTGRIVYEQKIETFGESCVTIQASDLDSGAYVYTLIVDEQIVASKLLKISK